MKVFVDTSAIIAFLDGADVQHNIVEKTWDDLANEKAIFATTNYVLVETFVLLQNRLGLSAARMFAREIIPMLEIEWIDAATHEAAILSVLAAGRRNLSLVDCTSFALMRHRNIWRALTLDAHFREQGFECLPE